jgi:hypothetical protein
MQLGPVILSCSNQASQKVTIEHYYGKDMCDSPFGGDLFGFSPFFSAEAMNLQTTRDAQPPQPCVVVSDSGTANGAGLCPPSSSSSLSF